MIGAIVVLILIVIAFRGCLDARKSRSFQNYVSDLSSITAETDQLSSSFFERLQGGGGDSASDISFDREVDGDRGTAQALLDRAEGLDAPGEVEGAQEQIVLSFTLRHDALEGIAANLPKVGSNDGRESRKASNAIYKQMKVFSASDILYARARDQIEQALVDQDVTVDDGVPQSRFLPKEPDYLDPEVTADAIGGVVAGGGGGSQPADDSNCRDDGLTHGVGLVDGSSALLPSGTTLTADSPVTATAGDNEIEVAVQNQGQADEENIEVSVSSDTGISGSGTIDQISSQATATVAIPLDPAPEAGETVTLDVEVTPVGCEQVEDNNVASYSVTF